MTPHPTLWQRLVNRAMGPVRSVLGAARAVQLAALISGANRWREAYNPLRGLDLARALSLTEAWDRGEFADLMWLYRWIERHDETLSSVINRREAALLQLDWDIKTIDADDLPPGVTEAQAQAQAETLRAAYERLDNLRQAIAHLALADFRGFSFVEKQAINGPEIDHLECVDHWNLLRAGLHGDWHYNDSGMARSTHTLPADTKLDLGNFIHLTCERHVDWVALFCVLRKGMAQKNWAAFVEAFGLNQTIIIGPPGITDATKETAFENAATSVAEAGSGFLPNGSAVHWANSEKGQQPFKEYIEGQAANIVLAGTGGKLTMLNEATGLGSGNADAHSDTFAEIAKSHAQRISEAFQRGFDRGLLAAKHPGEPVLAYFELAANEETDTTKIVEDIAKLSAAGFTLKPEQIAEKTGYEVEAKAEPAGPEVQSSKLKAQSPEDDEPPIANRKSEIANRAESDDAAELAAALAEDLAPFRDRLAKIADLTDPESQRLALRGLLAEFPELTVQLLRDPAATAAWQQVLGRSLAEGLQGEAIRNRYDPGQPRDGEGQWDETGAGGAGGGKLASTKAGVGKLKKSKERAFSGESVETKTKLSKQEAGAIGEQVVIEHLKAQGLKDARALNTRQANFPVDLVQNHDAIEVKTGLVSNGESAQQWRATIGQPGKKETEWLRKASPEAKKKHNLKKQQAILDRKQAALKEISKEVGRKVKGKTMTTIINPDTRTVDVYEFDGFHLRIPWNSPQAKSAYVTSYKYA